MSPARPTWYIESQQFRELLAGDPVQVLDGGSRGDTFAPFDDLSAPISVTGFEPDPGADGPRTISRALWSSSGEIEVNLADAVSSVYPPNMDLLRLFPDRVGVEGRKTERIAKLEAISIDDAVRQGVCKAPDFIKLDIHSAEYEALEGAEEALEGAVGILVETWHSPVHDGQRLHGDVERLLNESGFHLFDHCPAAAWRNTLDGDTSAADRPRLMASESLFFKAFSGDHPPLSLRHALVAIALLDLYGYTNHAARLSRDWAGPDMLSGGVQQDVERELLRLRATREAAARPDPSGAARPSFRQRLGAALSALRGAPRTTIPARPAPHPLHTGTQRLSRGPWT